jgi:hypothetical protein
MTGLGHRVADEAGVTSSLPFSNSADIVSTEQMDRVVDALDEEGGEAVFLQPTWVEMNRYLEDHDFSLVSQDPASGLSEWRRGTAR